jgi:hypothetical protein
MDFGASRGIRSGIAQSTMLFIRVSFRAFSVLLGTENPA